MILSTFQTWAMFYIIGATIYLFATRKKGKK